jgi:hypothetical protein
MSSVAPEEEQDKKILVIEKRRNEDGTTEEIRKTMTLREAYSKIDYSKQISLCKSCGHDIDEHEATKDYRTKFAGACSRKYAVCKFEKGKKYWACPCTQYKPGPVTTQKELEKKKVKGRRGNSRK